MRLYVHGAGRTGRDAWPEQPTTDAAFADHHAEANAAAKAALVVHQAPEEPFAVIAHSLGAVVTTLAIRDHGLAPTHVVLAEPALYDVARGDVAIEAHIEPVTRARAQAASGDLFGYWQIIKPLMFGSPATREGWDQDAQQARRFAELEPPWGHGVQAGLFATRPTLVITGGWNAEYESIADRLTAAGTQHVVLSGARHRVQDHPDFNSTLETFTSQGP